MPVIVDTNVLLVASGLHPEAKEACQLACNNILIQIQTGNQKIVLDDIGLIIAEYGNMLNPRKSRAGDIFLLWLLNNRHIPTHCDEVSIYPIYDYDGTSIINFAEFPQDEQLANFDLSDRKFVAVAIAHLEHPPILNATDSDWNAVREILTTYGLTVESLCPELFL